MYLGFAVIVMLLGSVGVPASAQAPGLPVQGGGTPKGVTIGASIGFPNEDALKGSAYQAELSYGGRRAGIAAFVSRRDVSGTTFGDTSWGGLALTYKAIGGPLVPFAVNLQAGAAFHPSTSSGNALWHVPVGVGISWVFARPLVAIKPWVAPRLDVSRVSGGNPQTTSDFGMSAGIDFGLLNGIGVQVAFDRVWADQITPGSFGVGLSYTFK
ncbi:MAG: hypothetical protein ABI647_09925 [Gemmatimonadota bacterium]